MRLQTMCQRCAAAALACRRRRSRAQADLAKVAKLRNPAALTETGAGDLQGELRHQQGDVRHRGAPRLGADRRRPLLQPRQERLLRRCAVLPRDPGLHGAVRHPRQPGGHDGLARRADRRTTRSSRATSAAT